MCISTLKKKLLNQQAELEAKLAKVDAVEISKESAVKAVGELLQDCADALPDEIHEVWEEILAIGSQFNLTVQPIATEELQQWEVAQAENEELKQKLSRTKDQYLELLETSANRVKELQAELEKEKSNYSTLVVIDKVLNERAEDTERLLSLARLEIEDLKADKERCQTEIEELRSQLPENYRQGVGQKQDTHTNPIPVEDEEVLTGKEYDAAVEEELGLDDDGTDIIPALTLWQPWATLIAQ